MNKSFGQSDPNLERYVYDTFTPEDEVLTAVRTRAEAAGLPAIHVAALDGLHLEVLTRAAGARRAVEIGTLAGYSGVCILRGLAAGGSLDTFELDEKHAAVARESFRLAGFSTEQARVHVGPAKERLADIEKDGPFDLVFIDADKVGYPDYTAWAAEHLRVGGVVLLDNSFLFGRVIDEPTGEYAEGIRAMRRTHELLTQKGGRFRATMLPTGEGLAFGVKVR